MLGDIQYNETGILIMSFCQLYWKELLRNQWFLCITYRLGHIISAGVTSLVLYGKMNVSEADLNQEKKDVLGSQVIFSIADNMN